MSRVAALFGSRYFLWLVLALPGALQTWRYVAESIYFGEYLHWTGETAAQLLLVTLAITPLRLAFPGARWLRWLMTRRRYLGVATFGYSLLHAVAYLDREESLAGIVEDALGLPIGTGWVAFIVFLLLAATSNDASVRRLRRRWKTLHRTVYAAAVLTFVHWILTAFDPLTGSLYLAAFVAIEAFRVWQRRRGKETRSEVC